MKVIGLGQCGCSIAEKFMQFPQYDVYRIDADENLRSAPDSYVMETWSSPEEYEDNCPNLKDFLGETSGDVLFIVGGSGMISGASLRILEQIRGARISILYVQPNKDFLFGDNVLQERVTFGVFQNYARSGLFERLYLVSNVDVEKSLGNIPVTEYFDKINEAVASTLHMIHVWQHSKAIMGNLSAPAKTDRITTFGVMDVESGEEKLFFPLEHVTDKNIFYAINEKSLAAEGQLLGRIQEQVKQKMEDVDKVSFGIFPTDYDGSQGYVFAHTKIIQGEG